MTQPLSYTLAELATYASAAFQGDGALCITGLNTLQAARATELSFLANPAYARYLNSTSAGAVILSSEQAATFTGNALVMANPYLGYAKLSHLFDTVKKPAIGIHPSAVVSPDAQVHSQAAIGANVVIEAGVSIAAGVRIDSGTVVGHDTVIGRDTYLARQVTLCQGVHVGERVVIHCHAVIGSDGFGNAQAEGRWHKIAQLGGVIIGDDVEIGAGTCIDRGALGNTVISEGVRLDNLIQIGHNVVIGKHTAMAALVGISGSTCIGANCLIGGHTGFAGHLDITDNVHISGMGMITRSITKPGTYASGTGFMDAQDWRKNAVRFRQLYVLAKRLDRLEATLQMQSIASR